MAAVIPDTVDTSVAVAWCSGFIFGVIVAVLVALIGSRHDDGWSFEWRLHITRGRTVHDRPDPDEVTDDGGESA